MRSSLAPRGPRGYPLLGNVLGLRGGALAFLRSCANEYGDLVPLQFLGKRVLFVNHPDHIGQVLTTHHRELVKASMHRTDRALVGDGISLREGDAWRHGR